MSKSPNRLLGVIFGAVYVVVGLLGFTVTGGTGFFATAGGLLLGIFAVSRFHTVARLLIGAALRIAGRSSVGAAKAPNTPIGAAYLLLGILGLFIVGSAFNVLALNAADHVLHFASAAVLLGVGLGVEKSSRTALA